MMAAAARTPSKPLGMKGIQLSALTAGAPTAMKKRITPSLRSTIRPATRALSLIPITRRAVINKTMIAAGKLAILPSGPPAQCGGLVAQ